MPDTQPKNVLLVINHDVSRDWFGCYGAPIHTPNIDSLADGGFTFGRHYCQYPLCGPSRASLFTGCRPDTTRLYNNTEFYSAFRERVGVGSATLPEHFRNRGYWTQAVNNVMGVTAGKTMDDSRLTAHDVPSWSAPRWEIPHGDPPAWAPAGAKSVKGLQHYALPSSHAMIRRRAQVLRYQGKDPLKETKLWGGPAVEMADAPDDAYPTGKMTDQMVRFLEEFSRSEEVPFFLTIGYDTGHYPWVAPRKYWDLYDPESLILPRTAIYPAGIPDYAGRPEFTQTGAFTLPEKGYSQEPYEQSWQPTPEQLLELRHGYFACVSFFDAQVGRLVDNLERLGLRKSTIVAVTTDHGLSMGEHGHWHKMTNYEPDHGVPLVLSVPGHGGCGSRVEAFTEHVDLYPTLCDLCDLPIPDHLEGTSFVPLFDDPGQPWKKAAFGQVERTLPDTGEQSMGYTMRTERYRFTRWENLDLSRKVEARELYDYERDPLETVNCVNDPDYAEALADHESMMDAGWRGAQPPGLE